jgi:hypothetical protein
VPGLAVPYVLDDMGRTIQHCDHLALNSDEVTCSHWLLRQTPDEVAQRLFRVEVKNQLLRRQSHKGNLFGSKTLPIQSQLAGRCCVRARSGAKWWRETFLC